MANTTFGLGVVLILLGVVGSTGSGAPTALIPAAFGLVLLVLGLLAHAEHRRRHAMHAAAAVGLVGALVGVPGVVGLLRWLAGEGMARPWAVVLRTAMFLLCGAFVALCVRSFVAARRARRGT
jgi:hypothetical protein